MPVTPDRIISSDEKKSFKQFIRDTAWSGEEGNFDEAIENANRLPFGLAAFVHTENGRQANMAGDAIEAGMIGINTAGISAVDMPFGGIKESGFGSEGGPEGLDGYYVHKAIHQA